jgi:hypothetical protein
MKYIYCIRRKENRIAVRESLFGWGVFYSDHETLWKCSKKILQIFWNMYLQNILYIT